MKRLVLFTIALGCSWAQFDKYSTDSPVTAFTNRPFGSGVAIATDKTGSAVLASAGNPGEGARFFALLDGHSEPSTTPTTNAALCELSVDAVSVGRPCLSAAVPFGIGVLFDPLTSAEHTGCFALGYGKQGDSTLPAGPTVFCSDSFLFTLGAIPDSTRLAKAFSNRSIDDIRAQKIAMASLPAGAGPNPPLVFGVEGDDAAFVYKSIVAGKPATALARTAPTSGDRFGAAVALGAYAEGTYVFVSAPTVGKIFVYALGKTDADPVVHTGCITGATGLGETLTVADVDSDGAPDVLAREGNAVKVFKGAGRPKTAAATDCANTWDASSAATLSCAETRGAGDCANADFGRAIAAGDFDADGKTDVAVGAPSAAAEGNAGAGTVFLFTPSTGTDVQDVRYLGQPAGGDAFGWAVASGKVGTQDTLAVGARGKAVSYVVWCTGLPGSPQGARCRK